MTAVSFVHVLLLMVAVGLHEANVAFAQESTSKTPLLVFSTLLNDSSIEGIAIDDTTNTAWVTSNQKWSGGFQEGWIHRIHERSGRVLQSRQLARNVGACTYFDNKIAINPTSTTSSKLSTGLAVLNSETLAFLWASSETTEISDKGVPPVVTSKYVIQSSTQGGISVFSAKTGELVWTKPNIQTGKIAVSETMVYAVNQATDRYPLLAISLETGKESAFNISSITEAETTSGVALSDDGESLFTVRKAGLVRHDASDPDKPASLYVNSISKGTYKRRWLFFFLYHEWLNSNETPASDQKYGPVLSKDQKTIFASDPMSLKLEAFSIVFERRLWRETMRPTTPLLVSNDSAFLYTFDSRGALARLRADTGEFVWKFRQFPPRFVASAMVLTHDDSRILVTGNVFDEHKAYVFSLMTDPVSSLPPTTSPVEQPSTTLKDTPEPQPVSGAGAGGKNNPSSVLVRCIAQSIGFTLLATIISTHA